MKTSNTFLIASAVLALAGSVAAFAQTDATPAPPAASDHPARPHRPGMHLPAEIMAKYDVNKDGKLDETERAALKADVDAGKVTLPKHGPGGPGGGPGGPGGPGGRPVPPEVLAKYDVNKDGKLDATERAAMKADIASGAFVPPHRPAHHKAPADAPAAAPDETPAAPDSGTATIVPKRARQ